MMLLVDAFNVKVASCLLSLMLLFLTKKFNDSVNFVFYFQVTNCTRGSLCQLRTSDAGGTWELQLQLTEA